jgi:hypothetical protein
MNVCGIMISKKISKRFPGKNLLLYRKNAEILVNCCGAGNVYMITDDNRIKAGCQTMGISVIDKNINIDDELSYLDVLRFAYYSIYKKYDIIVTILCNSVGHEYEAVMEGIEEINSNDDVIEVRSFDQYGVQSGIFIFRADKLPEKWHHMASIVSNGKEIHYRSELDENN